MTKVSIIEVDLGADIQDIINDEISTLTAHNQEILATARATAELTQQVSDAKRAVKELTQNGIQQALTTAYQKLQEAGDSGVPAPDLLELVRHQIPTSSAFTTRMKTYLRGLGNPHIMIRKQIRQQPHYLLQPYNLEQEADQPEANAD